MTCTFCGTTDKTLRFVGGPRDAALCENCVSDCVDFLGATAKLPLDQRPTHIEPRSAWDKRSGSTPTLFERRHS